MENENTLYPCPACGQPSGLPFNCIVLSLAELEAVARKAWDARVETKFYNVHDPDGSRAAMEKDWPTPLRSIGLCMGTKERWVNFNEYWQQALKEVEGV